AVSKVPTISVSSSSNSEYVIQGSNLVGVAGIEFTVSYSSTLSSPTVTYGGLVSGALPADNSATADSITNRSINFAFVKIDGISGTGQIAKISFATATGP